MLRIRQEESRQISLVDLLLPPEVLELPDDLAKLDAWLDDERFFTPSGQIPSVSGAALRTGGNLFAHGRPQAPV